MGDAVGGGVGGTGAGGPAAGVVEDFGEGVERGLGEDGGEGGGGAAVVVEEEEGGEGGGGGGWGVGDVVEGCVVGGSGCVG